jgi:hypothetical protein
MTAPKNQPTEAQLRVLRFCAAARRNGSPGWVFLVQIESVVFLEDDDVIVVPSLVERGWLYHDKNNSAVRITPAGAAVADGA